MTEEKAPPMVFVRDSHLGGYVKSDQNWPNGDPLTYCTAVWDWLIAKFRPRKMLDVGCGEGHTVKYFLGKGVDVLGVEGCQQALASAVVKERHLIRHDYTLGPLALSGFELVWCCEFVEHVEAAFVENVLASFDSARIVCMTHAFPGQEGYHHVNCQPPDYWIEKMKGHGFFCDWEACLESRRLDPDGHWRRSGLIFLKI